MSETTTLWVLHKDGRSITCVVSGEHGHEELRVLIDTDIYLREIHTVHDGLIARAHVLQRGFEARGWTLPHASESPAPRL